jgi:pimeloyl-ACP methyl ester carboxylesterase
MVCILTGSFSIVSDSLAEDTTLLPAKEVRVNGISLHYVERGKGIPVVFVHGSLDDYRYWSAQMEPFGNSYQTIAYSRRYNYPNENKITGNNHSAVVEAEDLAGFLKELKLPAAHVVGISYGAYTALFLALKHPDLVRSLVIAEPPLMRWLPDLPRGKPLFQDFFDQCWTPVGNLFRAGDDQQALRKTIEWFVANGYRLPGGMTTFDSLPEDIRTYLLQNSREWKALTLSTDAFPKISYESIRKMSIPTLMLSGEKSMQINRIMDAELERLLPKNTRVMIPNASHDMWNENPEACRDHTLAFLSSQSD